MTGRIVTALTTALIATTTPALAQDESNRVAAETDWAVFQGSEPKECWAVTAPKETVNTRDGNVVSVRRGDILLFVTYRPEQNISGEVSFTGGYPFADGSTATLEIAGTTFELFTEGEYAWPATPADDQKIVTAIKRGADAVVTARSSRGTQTKDTFSLLGATSMIEEAEKLCAG
ncbi:MAG: hypothetical protein LJE62_09890 [Silicimonas sp.]|nr:hypothetical protein [Silicimonas sp.]